MIHIQYKKPSPVACVLAYFVSKRMMSPLWFTCCGGSYGWWLACMAGWGGLVARRLWPCAPLEHFPGTLPATQAGPPTPAPRLQVPHRSLLKGLIVNVVSPTYRGRTCFFLESRLRQDGTSGEYLILIRPIQSIYTGAGWPQLLTALLYTNIGTMCLVPLS